MRTAAALTLSTILTLTPATARAQTRESPAPGGAATATWGGVGIGLGSVGALLQLDLSRYREARLVRGRLTAHSNLGGLGTQQDESLTELSALIGRGAVCCGGNWGSVAVGGGLVLGRRGSDAAQFTTVGLAAEAALISRRRPHLAVAALANVNPKRSFVAVSVSLLIGRAPFAASMPRIR